MITPTPPITPITEDWLRSVGFKWHQLERQPEKMWLLWLGDCTRTTFSSFEDLGIEIASNRDYPIKGSWSVWLRADHAHRYCRFIHIRYITSQEELIALVEALTGQRWNPENNLYGSMRTPEQATAIRKEDERIDIKWLHNNHKWNSIEKDDTRGRALPEHMQAAIDANKAQ